MKAKNCSRLLYSVFFFFFDIRFLMYEFGVTNLFSWYWLLSAIHTTAWFWEIPCSKSVYLLTLFGVICLPENIFVYHLGGFPFNVQRLFRVSMHWPIEYTSTFLSPPVFPFLLLCVFLLFYKRIAFNATGSSFSFLLLVLIFFIKCYCLISILPTAKFKTLSHRKLLMKLFPTCLVYEIICF